MSPPSARNSAIRVLTSSNCVPISLRRAATARLRVLVAPDGGVQRAPFSGEATVYLLRRGDQLTSTNAYLWTPISADHATIKDGRHALKSLEPGSYKAAVATGDEYAESDPFQVGAQASSQASAPAPTRSRSRSAPT